MELFIGQFDQFIDHLVWNATKTTLIILNIDQELSIPSTFQRSSVQYLKNVELIDLIHIDSLQKLMVYLSMKQVNHNDESIAIWELPSENLILSKLTKLNNKVILGFNTTTDLSTYKKWI